MSEIDRMDAGKGPLGKAVRGRWRDLREGSGIEWRAIRDVIIPTLADIADELDALRGRSGASLRGGGDMRDGRPEYIDICHPAKGQPHTAIVLWIHAGGGIEKRSARGGKEHDDFWERNHAGSGRVDTAKGVGALGLAPGIGRRKARMIAEDAVAEFPGIRFWVFYEDDWGVTMQEFWEATS